MTCVRQLFFWGGVAWWGPLGCVCVIKAWSLSSWSGSTSQSTSPFDVFRRGLHWKMQNVGTQMQCKQAWIPSFAAIRIVCVLSLVAGDDRLTYAITGGYNHMLNFDSLKSFCFTCHPLIPALWPDKSLLLDEGRSTMMRWIQVVAVGRKEGARDWMVYNVGV